MNALGWKAGECRLPLVEPSEQKMDDIDEALRAAGLMK
jgi:4-hydroxy-tetrahydrodipicolinate synthase